MNQRRALTCWAAATALLAAPLAHADIVFLNDGAEISGQIVRVDSSTAILNADGHETSYPLSQVLKVKLVHVYGVPGEKTAADISDPALKAALKSPAKPSNYPNDGELTYLDEQSCTVNEDKSAMCASRVINLVLRERDKETAANVIFDYIDGAQTARIDWARAINGNVISNLDDTSVEAGSENSQFPDYDRLRSLKFAIPDVATGTFVDYRFQTTSTVNVATQPFMAAQEFRFFEPAALARFSLTTPKDIPFNAVAVGLPKDALIQTKDLGSSVRRTWEVRNIPSFKNESDMPPYERMAPFVAVAPAQTWTQAASAAAAAIGPNLNPGPAIRAQVAHIIKNKKTAAAKVEALYDWVSRAIKYEPVTMDAYGYAPKSPDEIFAAKVGNALDKPFLLFIMLRQAGFKPQFAYFENKSGYLFQETLPNLGQFSAAAVLLDLNGKRLTLFPLEDTRRWLETPDWLQGVHGLIVFGPEQGQIIKNPLTDAAQEGERGRMKLSLSSAGSLSGSAVIWPQGENEASWRAMKDWKKQDIEHQMENFVYSIYPNARLRGYSIDGLNDPTRGLAIRLSFSIKNYALTASGGYMAFRLPWVVSSANDVGTPTREEPIFWWNRWSETRDITVTLPKGYKIYYVLPPARIEGPGQSYQASYTPARGALHYSETETRTAVDVSPDQYPGYKAYSEAIARYTEKWIVLKKN